MSSTDNVYEFRNAPLKNPHLRERVIWITVGGGGLLMTAIAAIIAFTSDEGLGEGLKKSLVYLILGFVLAILPFGLRVGIRSQNERRAAFSIEIKRDGILKIALLENVPGQKALGLVTREWSLDEVSDVKFVKSVQSVDGTARNRSVDYFIVVSPKGGEDVQILIPPDRMGQSSGIPKEEQAKFLAAARPFWAKT